MAEPRFSEAPPAVQAKLRPALAMLTLDDVEDYASQVTWVEQDGKIVYARCVVDHPSDPHFTYPVQITDDAYKP